MMMVASCVVLTVVVLNYHHRTAETHVMPLWVSYRGCTQLSSQNSRDPRHATLGELYDIRDPRHATLGELQWLYSTIITKQQRTMSCPIGWVTVVVLNYQHRTAENQVMPLWVGYRTAETHVMPLWVGYRTAETHVIPLWVSYRTAETHVMPLWASYRTAETHVMPLWAS